MKRGAIKVLMPGGRPSILIEWERPSGADYEIAEVDASGHTVGLVKYAPNWEGVIAFVQTIVALAIGRDLR